jgi:hypothetical protein
MAAELQLLIFCLFAAVIDIKHSCRTGTLLFSYHYPLLQSMIKVAAQQPWLIRIQAAMYMCRKRKQQNQNIIISSALLTFTNFALILLPLLFKQHSILCLIKHIFLVLWSLLSYSCDLCSMI